MREWKEWRVTSEQARYTGTEPLGILGEIKEKGSSNHMMLSIRSMNYMEKREGKGWCRVIRHTRSVKRS